MKTESMDLPRRRSATWLLIGTFLVMLALLMVLFALPVWLLHIPIWLPIVIATAISTSITFVLYRKATDVVLEIAEAEPADEFVHARLFNVAAGLCASLGVLPTPRLFVVDDDASNIAVAGTSKHDAALIVTRGLLERCTLLEIEALVAQALVMVRGDLQRGPTIAVTTIALPAALSELWEAHAGLRRLGASFERPIARVLRRLFPGKDQFIFDAMTANATHYPPALATALENMATHSVLVMGSLATSQLWLAPSTMKSKHIGTTHVALPARIAALHEF